MSNGYGYKTAVSPANIGAYGYGYGGYGTQMPMTLPAQQGNQAFPIQAMANQAMPLQTTANQAMPMQALGNQPMPVQAMANQAMMKTQTQMPPAGVPSGAIVTPSGGNVVSPIVEESYVENILRLNRGKMATFYMTYENNSQWNAKIFKGIIEAAGRDHIIISDPTTGMRYLLLTLNLDYVTFDEPIAYEYPFQGGVVSSATPLGR